MTLLPLHCYFIFFGGDGGRPPPWQRGVCGETFGIKTRKGCLPWLCAVGALVPFVLAVEIVFT